MMNSKSAGSTVFAYRALLLAGVMMAAVSSGAAHAQGTAGAGARNDVAAEDDAMGDIVVTAQRREERLVDVPLSVSALGAASLERAGVRNVSDVAQSIPNVSITQTVGSNYGPMISIRGLAPSSDTSLGRDQPVGIYIDGVPIAKSTGAAFDTIDLERVEVLRGPQGTLYGKNTIGGAVNLITRRPSGEFGGRVKLGIGEHGLFTQRVAIDLPTMGEEGTGLGTLKAKFAYSGMQFDGFYKNFGPSRDFGRIRQKAGRADVVWDPTSNLTISYGFDRTVNRGTPPMLAISALGLITPVSPLYPLVSPYVYTTRPKGTSSDSTFQSDLKVTGHAITTEYRAGEGGLGDVTLKSITAFRKFTTLSQSDFDGTPREFFRFTLNNDYKQFSEELQIIGIGSRLKYTAGLFYMKDQYTAYNPRWQFTLGSNRYSLNMRGADNYSIAGYGQVTWTPPIAEDRLSLTVGMRYTKEHRESHEMFQDNASYTANPSAPNSGVFLRDATGAPITRSGGPAAGALPGNGRIGPTDLIPLEAQNSWKRFNPEFNATYKLGDNWNLYGRVATGFKSGGFNDTSSNNAAFLAGYDPEKLTSFELGTKGRFFDRRLSLSAAVFHSIYKDFQASVFVPAVVSTSIINAGKAHFTGVELEGQARPIDNLTLNFGAGYINARYKEFILPNGTDVTDSYVIPLNSKYNYLVGGEYRIGLGDFAHIIASLNYSWRSSQYSSITPDPLAKRKAFGLVDGRISLAGIKLGGSQELELSVWGKNLTDEKYWVSAINLSTFAVRQWGDPRTFGAEVSLKF